MGPDPAEPRRVTLPPAGLLFAGLALGALVLMIVLLVLMLMSLNSLEQTVSRTNERIGRTNEQIREVNREFEPIAELSPPFLRRGVPYLRHTRADLQRLRSAVPEVERTLGALAASVIPLVRSLDQAPIVPTLVRASELLMEIERLALVHDANVALETVPDVRRAVVDVSEHVDELEGSVDALRADFRDALGVLCDMLEHLRSIDRKTGGEVAEPEPDAPERPRVCRRREPERS